MLHRDVTVVIACAFALGACRSRGSAPVAAAPSSSTVGVRAPVVITSAPLPPTIVVQSAPNAPVFPEAPQVSGHGTGGTCEAACRVEQQSYLRTVCGAPGGGFREMDRECRAEGARDLRECVARCRR